MLRRIWKAWSLEPTRRKRPKWARCSSCSLASTRTSAPIAPQALEQPRPTEQRKPSPVSALNGANQRLQTFITREDEVFLHLHLHIRPCMQVPQSIGIDPEFVGHRVGEQLNAGYSSDVICPHSTEACGSGPPFVLPALMASQRASHQAFCLTAGPAPGWKPAAGSPTAGMSLTPPTPYPPCRPATCAPRNEHAQQE